MAAAMIDTSEEDSFFPEQSLIGEIKDAFTFFTDTVFNELHCITCTDKFIFQHPSSDKSPDIDPIKVYQRIEEARQLCLRKFTQTLTEHNIEKTSSIDHSSPSRASNVISDDEDDYQIPLDEPLSDEKPITQVPLRIITQQLKCPVGKCGKLVKSKESLNGHLLRRHDIQPFRCKVHQCKASFKNARKLGKHLTSIHGKLRNWPCGACGKDFTDHNRLGRHNFMVHEEGRFGCSSDGCLYVAPNRAKMDSHQKCHRLATLLCAFPGCTCAFKYPGELAEHELKHRKGKLYRCHQCRERFSNMKTLKHHANGRCPNGKFNVNQ